jgi:putative tryptophan/tyrosine transport system substrate-binding protein
MTHNAMRRREFITLLGGAAVAWPIAARAQQAAVPTVGFLTPSAPGSSDAPEAFRRGLAEAGYVEGRNVAIEYRYVDGHYEQLPALAAELVRRRVTVIAAFGTSAPGLAAKAATSTIPIVFQTGSDPVADGLVASMNRPGGNVTGVSRMSVETDPKRLEFLHEAVPKATVIAMLVNPDSPRAEFQIQQVERAARSLGLRLEIVRARAASDLDGAFATMVRQGAGAALVGTDPSMNNWYEQIAALSLRHGIPTMSGNRAHVVAGGLMSYDSSLSDSNRQGGVYVGRILKGEKPADLPVMQPTRFEFVLNLKTAKALGLDIPLKLQAFAEEVIE